MLVMISDIRGVGKCLEPLPCLIEEVVRPIRHFGGVRADQALRVSARHGGGDC
jgi:hypothetical protein